MVLVGISLAILNKQQHRMCCLFNGGRMLAKNLVFQDAYRFFKQKQFKKSFLKLISISNEFSNDLIFLSLLSEVQFKLNDQTAWLKTLKTISVKSHHVQDQLKYINALISVGERNQALDLLLDLEAKELPQSQFVQLQHGLLNIYALENDFEGLNEVCQKLKGVNYSDAETQYCSSIVEISRGQYDRALEQLRNIINQYSNFDKAWVALALCHQQMGDSELAKANLQKALDINAKNSTAIKYLATWSETPSDVESSLEKINFYLQEYNFDEDISECHAKLLIKNGRTQHAQAEMNKLSYYFGKTAQMV